MTAEIQGNKPTVNSLAYWSSISMFGTLYFASNDSFLEFTMELNFTFLGAGFIWGAGGDTVVALIKFSHVFNIPFFTAWE